MNSIGKELQIPLYYVYPSLVLTISAHDPNTLCEQLDAEEYGEAIWQLMEGCEYEFEFSDPGFTFTQAAGIVRHSRNRKSHGLLRPNNYTGTLRLTIVRTSSNEEAWLSLEIRSRKLTYRSDYRFMLENITEHCTDLLLRHTSPVLQNFEPDYSSDEGTLYQRFSFVRSIVQSDEFTEAIHRILLFPATKWKAENEERSTIAIRHFGKREIRQLVTGGKRIKVNTGTLVTSVPRCIYSSKQQESTDTHENRFVRYVLVQFLEFCMTIEQKTSHTKTGKEAQRLIHRLEEYLSHDLFRTVSPLMMLKLNSPVLQHKEGYREVLRAWLQFDLAAKLIWKGGNDVYSSGKRDIAVLYEYWVFFQLLEAVQRVFNLHSESLAALIVPTNDGLGLQLRKGEHTAINGVSDAGRRLLNITFSFNRSFRKTDYPDGGSWSLNMFPDYTLSLWPVGLTPDEAEEKELIVHLHFDAKYKTKHPFGHDESGREDEKDALPEKRYKAEDLIKMHAYRDAIRRTAGAYIIYPGTTPYVGRGFREILPGLGAFAVSPSRVDTGVYHIELFLKDVSDHLMNRASQREQLSAHIWSVYRRDPVMLDASLPEFDSREERLLPGSTTVLVGYYKSDEHLSWCTSQGLYNFRAGSGRGALQLTREVVDARYLLLYSKEQYTSELWEIAAPPQFWSKKDLIDTGYPNTPTQNGYLVLSIRKPEPGWFDNMQWEVQQFKTKNIPLRFPLVMTLMELLLKSNNQQDFNSF